MPKRKNTEMEDYKYLSRKLRKIERKLRKVRRKERHSTSSNSSNNNYEPENSNSEEFPIESVIITTDDELQSHSIMKSSVIVPESSTERMIIPTEVLEPSVEPSFEPSFEPSVEPVRDSAPEPALVPAPEPLPGPSTAPQETEVTAPLQLDSDILSILGEDPTAPKIPVKDILPALAVRLTHIATSGLSTEIRKELHNKYALPSNCTLIGAPALNPEVKAAITDSVLKRDQSIEGKQKQLAVAISCLTEAITPLLIKDKKDTEMCQLLMDAVRMLCDIQYKHTSIRRGLLLNNLKKDLKDQIQGTKVDSFLFGQNFADNLKTAKAITKSGAELKPQEPKLIVPKKHGPAGPSGPSKKPFPSSQPLNWKGPPPPRRSTGTPRTRGPAAPRGQPARSSRTSSQQGHTRSWR